MNNKSTILQQESQGRHLKRRKVTVSNSDYTNTIKVATEAVDEIVHTQLLDLLNIRSIAFEKQGLLSQALNDATLMIQSAPRSAIGYLRAGDAYMAAGQAHMAVDVYDEGLATILTTDPVYNVLLAHKQEADLRTQSRFDIIGKLPQELVHKIFLDIDPKYVWVCLKVSTLWYRKLSRCDTSWWRSVTITRHAASGDNAVCIAIPLVGNYVQHLALESPQSDLLNKYFHRHFMHGVFTSLSSLTLQGRYFTNISPADLEKTLLLLSSTLKTLKIGEFSYDTFPLRRILPHCRNLRELYCEAIGDIREAWFWAGEYLPNATCQTLVNLELTYSEATFDALCSHLMFCPNVSRLVIRTPSRRLLSRAENKSFTTYLPQLKIVGVNSSDDLPDLDSLPHFSGDNDGLLFMDINFYSYATLCESVVHIDAHATTLETLCIDYIEEVHRWPQSFFEFYPHLATLGRHHYDQQRTHDRRDYETYLQLEYLQHRFRHVLRGGRFYSNLRHLHYRSNKKIYPNRGQRMNYTPNDIIIQACTENLLVAIIRSSPLLTTLSLSHEIITSKSIWIALQEAVRVRPLGSLQFDSMSFGRVSDVEYQNFFSSLNRVHTLEIINCDFFDDATLLSLAASESVQTLIIAQSQSISTEGMTKFLKQVSDRPSHRLQNLSLTDIGMSLDKAAVRYLVTINGLQTLSITANCRDIDTATIDYLVNRLMHSSLKRVEISRCICTNTAMVWADEIVKLKKKGITLIIDQ